MLTRQLKSEHRTLNPFLIRTNNCWERSLSCHLFRAFPTGSLCFLNMDEHLLLLISWSTIISLICAEFWRLFNTVSHSTTCLRGPLFSQIITQLCPAEVFCVILSNTLWSILRSNEQGVNLNLCFFPGQIREEFVCTQKYNRKTVLKSVFHICTAHQKEG